MGGAEIRIGGEQSFQGQAGQQGPGQLGGDVAHHVRHGQAAGKAEAERHGGIQMRAADIAEGIDHRQHDEAEGEGDAHVGDGSAGGVVDDDGAGAGEDEGEGADGFGEQFAGGVHFITGVSNIGGG